MLWDGFQTLISFSLTRMTGKWAFERDYLCFVR
jgi:hypothetical protein